MMREKVTQLLEQALEKNKSLFLIDYSISEANHIRVILDGDKGVSVEDCIAVSREIEHNLDREEVDFSLEVMSAGVSEPLKLPRQYKKNVGRTLKLRTKDDSAFEGTLVSATEEAVTLQWKAREPKPVGKGKVTVQKEAVLPYKDIAEAKVMITFN
ncbi:ribosome assembly cofactor RimP [Altibacter sp.]|uniref:ribosome assembly cofactor RimP n=1 Tax=Altibacter sp. TaxID=2024823 RepID=UPI000C8EB63D|nr:ribosome assembly cofactor RimP [Altibacter sp.]MAP53905.1 ribosome assembly cofactor RimP [Altibacter sp.]|tara:strand:- start:377 stop:844 length:468 start_codon:yes stop_codon:yes gene_type:complete